MFAIFAVLIGVVVAIQARINGQLSVDLDNGLAAALVSFLTGLAIVSVLVFGFKREREALFRVFEAIKNKQLVTWELMGGVLGGFFVAAQSAVVPQIGVALFTIAVVAGQTISSLLVDKVGMTPSGKERITKPRIFGAVATLIAVAIAVFPDLTNSEFRFLPLTFALIVGVFASFQQGMNGRVNVVGKRPLATAWLNFVSGTIVVVIALSVDLALGATIEPLPGNFWVYTGGAAGLIFVAVSAYIIKHLGVLNFSILNIAGQLVGAILIDWLAPTKAGSLNGYLIFGTVMTIISIAVSKLYEGKKIKIT
ncbi:MAG: DMT family transporter [Actinobacteria bacterium]|jgi:bacterial/archaeal transporter family-2 protein|nr:DMT family transporter [Actinomycetota bacterium]MDA2981414.1 DMT family transporter [Actinomycetota bacterium]MDA2996241.1 DMT family transporter [Actinomycetota bacterium]